MPELFNPRNTSEVIPELRSDVFVGHEQARFAVGQVAEGDNSFYTEEDLAYHRLRANVYVHQTRMISEEYIAPNGGEYDEEDARSAHMVVLENCGDEQRLVGSMRLILRGRGGQLPIEKFFPDIFDHDPAGVTSCEVSRYITRHEEESVQREISWALFQRTMATAINHQLGPMYAVVDPALSRIMRLKRVPIKELAPPARVEEYNSTSLPVAIDLGLFAERLENRAPGTLFDMMAHEREFTYFGQQPSRVKIVTLGNIAVNAAGGRHENN